MADDITVTARLRDELSQGIDRARGKIKSLGQEADRSGSLATRGAAGFDRMTGAAGRVASVGGRALGAVAVAAGTATTAAVILGVKTAASMQNASVAFTTMLGSAQKAGAFLGQLKKFAATTPFEFPELQTAASSLISAGIEADKVIPIMTTLGNVTSGMGTGSEGVKRATVAIQQMNAAGRITGEDLNQLRDAGIPVYDLLAAATGKSKAEIVKLAQAGKLGQTELTAMMGALESGKGMERFAGLMEAQSKTLGGAWSTLKDNVQMGLANAIQPAVPALTNLVLAAGDVAAKAEPAISGFLSRVVSAGPQFQTAMAGIKDGFAPGWADALTNGLQTAFNLPEGTTQPILDALKGLEDGATNVGAIVRDILLPVLGNVTSVLPGWATPLGLINTGMSLLASNSTLAVPVITGLIAALTIAKAATMAWAVAQGVKNAADAVALVRLMVATPGTLAYAAAQVVARGATAVWTGAQWLLNAALSANPIGLVVALVAGLAAGIYVAYQKSATFRGIVDKVWQALKTAGTWIGNTVVKFAEMASKSDVVRGSVMGLQIAFDGLKSAIGWVVDKAQVLWDKLSSLKNIKLPSIDIPGLPWGDTATPRAPGGGNVSANLGRTVGAVSALSGGGPRITNALIGGGGLGRGSGDHQSGRALDLQGPGLNGLARKINATGGYAAFHGSGRDRHLHAVPAAGDTATSRVRMTRTSVASASGSTINVNVTVNNPSRDVDVTRAVEEAMQRVERDRTERA